MNSLEGESDEAQSYKIAFVAVEELWFLVEPKEILIIVLKYVGWFQFSNQLGLRGYITQEWGELCI